MRAITASGTSREIGRALGEEARRAVREQVFDSQTYADLRRWQGSKRFAAIMESSRAACPDYLEEIAGIAEGVGVAPGGHLPVELPRRPAAAGSRAGGLHLGHGTAKG